MSRLRGQALKWFHSKPEHIEISVDELVKELRDMFGDRVDRIAARREFENRVWRTKETFAEYAHDKTILANLIRIDEEELIEYLIDGISDHSLWNHAKLQKFKSCASLLEAFKGVVLPPATSRSARLDVSAREPSRKRNTVLQRGETWKQRSDGTVQREGATTRRAPTGPRRWWDEPGVATTRSSDGTACPDGVAMEFTGESMDCSGRRREMRLRGGATIAVDATTSPMVVH